MLFSAASFLQCSVLSYKHMISKHCRYATIVNIYCKEPNCTFSCNYLGQLRDHLEGHNLLMEMVKNTFSKMDGNGTEHV